MRHRKIRYSRRRRRAVLCVCTVCGNPLPSCKPTPKQYVAHVTKHHTAKVYA